MHSDEALYDAMLRGDLGAFDRLYARYQRPLFGFVRRHLADAHEAEDVLHETFLALLRERDAGRAAARSFRAWIYQVARNLCLNRLRAQRRGARALAAAPEPDAVAPPETTLEARERTEALRRAVAKLPVPLAEVYALRAGGLSYEELAEVLAVPVGTVKSRIHEMVARLREEMER